MPKDKIIIYEKPTCTTCRVVKREMTDKGVEFEAINYFERPLTVDVLKNLLMSAGLKPSEAMRTKEDAYKQFIAGKDLSDDEILKLMVEHPELIQRPIVVNRTKAVIPRPLEKLKEIL